MIASLKDARYQALRSLFGPWMAQNLVPTELVGEGHLPSHGPALVVANHRSVLDPYLFSARSRRTINWVMAPFVAQIPLFGWLAKEAGAIALLAKGSGKSEALMVAMERAWRQGRLVGIFPEGMDGFVQPPPPGQVGTFHGSCVRAILRAKVPGLRIVPAAIYSRGDTNLGDMPGEVLALFDRKERAFQQGPMTLVGYQSALVVVGRPFTLDEDYASYHHPPEGSMEPEAQRLLVAARAERMRQAVQALLGRAEALHEEL